MHYGEIKNCDIANGLGVRVTLFVSGCTNHCENCFQPQTWDFCYGKPFTSETEDELIRLLSPDYINGLTLLGGEPFESPILMWWNYVARSREEIDAAHASWSQQDDRFGRVRSRLPLIPAAPPFWQAASGE